MNKPDKAGEPSIEEILASIRQKTSEGQDAPQAADDAPPGLSFAERARAPEPSSPQEAPPALIERLNGIANGSASSGGSVFAPQNGAKRPSPFDQDLADMFDEPVSTGALPAAPKPEARPTPDLGAFSPKPAASVGESRSPALGVPTSPSVEPSPLPPLTASPLIASPPAAAEPPVSAPRPPSFGFPPLTSRGGFYPKSEPQLPPVSGASGPDVVAPPVASEPVAKDVSPAPPAPPASATRFSDLGSLVPGDAVGRPGRAPQSSFGAPPMAAPSEPAAPGASGVGRVLPELKAEPAMPSFGAPPASPPSFGKGTLAVPPLKVPAMAPPATKPAVEEPRLGDAGARAAAAPAPSFDRVAPAPSAAKTEANEVFATQALDALAQGLAASTAKAPETLKPAPSFAPAAPDLRASGAPAAAVLSGKPETAVAPPSSRSLEDVVADMLRPMLQKWVQENMPRIMEKALRSEMQRTLGPGGKPPGSAS